MELGNAKLFKNKKLLSGIRRICPPKWIKYAAERLSNDYKHKFVSGVVWLNKIEITALRKILERQMRKYWLSNPKD